MAIARQKTRQRELREARALIRRVQRGDRRAFELLYSAYEGRVYRFCHRLTGDDRTAAALVELTFARALADLPEDGFDTLDVPAYLLATARSLAYERSGEPAVVPGQWEGEVAAANQRLSPQERAVLVLRDLERPSRRRDRPCARRPGAGCSGPRRHGASAPACASCGCPRSALPARAGCPRCRPMPTTRWRPRSETSSPVTSPAARTAAPHCSRCARPRCATRRCPCPNRPAISDRASALRSARSACRRAAAAAAEPVAGGGRKTAVAVAMGALALVGVGVTIAAAHDDDGAAKPGPGSGVAPAPGTAERAGVRLRPWRSAPSACL